MKYDSHGRPLSEKQLIKLAKQRKEALWIEQFEAVRLENKLKKLQIRDLERRNAEAQS